jgi:membrane protein YdbS with pleckstrin-like domain
MGRALYFRNEELIAHGSHRANLPPPIVSYSLTCCLHDSGLPVRSFYGLRNMQLSPRAVFYFMMQNYVVWIFLSFWLAMTFGGNLQAAHMIPGLEWGSLANLAATTLMFFGILSLFNWAYCLLKVQSYRIELKPEGIALDYGILNKSHELLLFNKVQDILITRNLFEQAMGLSTVVIQNAMGQPQKIPGLEAESAEGFRDNILRYAAH